MSTFLTALGLAIVLEGIAYTAFPDQMKQALARLLETPNGTIRAIALTSAVVGLMIMWSVRG